MEWAPVSTGECAEWLVSGALWWRGKRLRRIGIVAVARKLLMALWRFRATGVIPEGAALKEA